MRSAEATQDSPPLAGYLLLITLAVLWGFAWPTMKMVLNELPIWTFRTICLLAGGGLLLFLTAVGGRSIAITRAEFWPVVLCSIFNVIGWQVFSAYGLDMMEAGRSSIIAFTMPVWAAMFSTLILGDRFTVRKLVALALGMAGLAVLIGPDALSLRESPAGALFMVAAAMCWALGSVFVKRFSWVSTIGAVMGWQLIIGAVPITLTAAVIEPWPDLMALSTEAMVAFVYVLVFPMAYCQWAYFKAVRMLGPGTASMGTLLIPVIGVMSSAWLLSEVVGLQEVAALALVVGALAVVLVPALRAQPAVK